MATTSTKDYVSILNNLIETCKDGEEGFRKSAANVKNSDLQTMFNDYSRQRAQFASDLQIEVVRLGGEPEKSGSVSGAVHRGWIDLKGSVTNSDDHSVLEEAERGEDVALKAYREALAKDLPTDLRGIVEKQYRQIEDSHRKVRARRDTTSDTATYDTLETSRTF